MPKPGVDGERPAVAGRRQGAGGGEKLVKETIELAEQVNHTEVHLVGAYPVTPINIAIELPEFDPSVYNDAIRGQHLLAMKALRQKFGINENMTHVEKGLPEEVIPDLAEHLQAG